MHFLHLSEVLIFSCISSSKQENKGFYKMIYVDKLVEK